MKKQATEFYTHHLEEYTDDNFDSHSWTSVDVLPFLIGKPWDNVALAFVHGLRPSSIRVTQDSVTLDSRVWRVTVYVDSNNIIEKIRQEVEVGLPDGVEHAGALRDALKYGINSPQCKWHQDADGYIAGMGTYSKVTKDGDIVPYPVDSKVADTPSVEQLVVIDSWISGDDNYRLVNKGAGPDELQIYLGDGKWKPESPQYVHSTLCNRISQLVGKSPSSM